MKTLQKGFTLIELLIVIGILAILLAITLVAINPQRQFSLSNNTKRRSDVNAILNAINQYMADNSGNLPSTNIDTNVRTLTDDTSIAATSRVDLCSAIVPTYIAALPGDPLNVVGTPSTNCTGYNTHYTIQTAGSGTANRISVTAPGAELGATIQVTR
jgi:type IV pilus assembly protein PilA